MPGNITELSLLRVSLRTGPTLYQCCKARNILCLESPIDSSYLHALHLAIQRCPEVDSKLVILPRGMTTSQGSL